jgi:hypothetical protein
MTILKNKNGQYKDFTCLLVACEMKGIDGKIRQAIQSASITAGLYNYTKAQERKAMYSSKNWLQVIEVINSL